MNKASFLIDARIWYQTKPVPDLRYMQARNWGQISGVDLWCQFLPCVLWTLYVN